MSKSEFFSKAIAWTKANGYSGIKANYESFEKPVSYKAKDAEGVYIPDITAQSQGRKSYIEIVVKKSDKQSLASKLQLLNKLAGIKNSKLILLAPHGHKSFTQGLIDQYHLNYAKLVTLAR